MQQVLERHQSIPATEERERLPTWMFLLALLAFELLVTWGFNQLLMTHDMVLAASGGQLDYAQAERVLMLSQRFAWLGYVAAAPMLLLRLCLVALCLQLGFLLFDSLGIRFAVLFRTAAIAALAQSAEAVASLAWFVLLDPSARAQHLGSGRNPLSVGVLIDPEGPLFILRPLAEYISVGSAVWVVLVTVILSSELRRPRWSLLGTCLLTWLLMVAVRFAGNQALALFMG